MRNIHEFALKIKSYLDVSFAEWGLFMIIVIAVFAAFALGRLSALLEERPLVRISTAPQKAAPTVLAQGGTVVASRSGSTYYYPWCAGAEKIAPGEQRLFASEGAARAAGLHPAKGCKGLE